MNIYCPKCDPEIDYRSIQDDEYAIGCYLTENNDATIYIKDRDTDEESISCHCSVCHTKFLYNWYNDDEEDWHYELIHPSLTVVRNHEKHTTSS